MNRTERLHAISELLRRAGSGGATAARLAAEVEVSVRTIKRDISALQQAGAPIWAQSGPGGGYVLDTSASLPPVAFTPAQAVAMATALTMLPPATPFAVDARAASAKLLDTLGAGALAQAEALAGRIWIRPGPPGDTPASGVVRAIERSLSERVVLSIRYRSADDASSQRRVEPIIAAWANGQWYLVAHCRLRQAIRWFRFDRIERADVTRDRYSPRPVTEVGDPPPAARPVG